MNLKATTGHYVNLFNETGLDMFFILNESNPTPTQDDYIFLEETVNKHIETRGCIIPHILEEEILSSNRFPAGIQIINHSIGYPVL